MPLSPIPPTLSTSAYEHLVLEALAEIAGPGSTVNINPPILSTADFRHLVLHALQYIATHGGGGVNGATGPQGATGAQGNVGATGATGPGLQSNVIYVNDGVTDIQDAVNSANAGKVISVSSGSFGGSTLSIANKSNIAIICPIRGQGSICELSSGRSLTLESTSTGSISINSLQIEGLTTLAGSGNNYFTDLACQNGITVSPGATGNYFFYRCEISGNVNIPNTFAGAIVFSECNFGGATFTLNNPSPLQVQFALCFNLPNTRPTNCIYGFGNQNANGTIILDATDLNIGTIKFGDNTTQTTAMLQGATGSQGNVGATGATGAAGNIGATGPSPDTSSFVQKTGDTMTGKLNLPASTTSSANFNLGTGTGPTSPLNGDIWIGSQRLSWKSTVAASLTSAVINDVNTFTSNQIISTTSNTAAALRITQLGSGEALRVEDETTPDATAFVISNTGKVGAGVTPDTSVCLSLDSTGVKFNDGTIQTTAMLAGATGATGPAGADGTGSPVYGEASKMDAGTITIATQGAYQSTGLTATLASFVDDIALGTTDTFALKNTSGATRRMSIYASYDATTAGSAHDLGLILALNGTPLADTECRATTSASGAISKLQTSWILDLADGDEIALFVANHSSTTTINFQRGRIIAQSIAGYGPAGQSGATGATGPALPYASGNKIVKRFVLAPSSATGTTTTTTSTAADRGFFYLDLGDTAKWNPTNASAPVINFYIYGSLSGGTGGAQATFSLHRKDTNSTIPSSTLSTTNSALTILSATLLQSDFPNTLTPIAIQFFRNGGTAGTVNFANAVIEAVWTVN